MHQFTLAEFLIAFAALTAIYFLGVFLHKRGLKNDKKKLASDNRKEVNRLLEMDEHEYKIS